VSERLAQEQPQPPSAPNFDVHIDLSGLANLIWQAFIDHAGELGTVVWQGVRDHLPEIAAAIWMPLSTWLAAGIRGSAEATWNGVFGAMPQLWTSLPADLTLNLPAYRAIAADPVPLALGGATLAIVLLGLRTLFGAMVGRDHVITHVSGRLIPAVFLVLAYPVLVARGLELVNQAAASVAARSVSGMLAFPSNPANQALVLPYVVLWLLLIWFALRLFLRLAYSLFRFLVALVFGPVALILWAIPQTEWVTWFWLRELVGWGTTPLLVVVALALAVPLATGQSGFLAATALGIAGLMAAYDLVGLLSTAQRGGGGGLASTVAYARMAASAASGGGAGVAAAAIPANRVTTTAEQYGYQ
jgi:hypothetical protein